MEIRWLKNRLYEIGIKQKDFMKQIGITEQHFKWLENKPKQKPETIIKSILSTIFANR